MGLQSLKKFATRAGLIEETEDDAKTVSKPAPSTPTASQVAKPVASTSVSRGDVDKSLKDDILSSIDKKTPEISATTRYAN